MDGTQGTGPATVDTAQVDEGAERVDRAREGLHDVRTGLDLLPVVAVATGADAILDALADLGRQWDAALVLAAAGAGSLADDLRAASAAYTLTEQEAAP